MKRWIKNHQILAYISTTMMWSWSIWTMLLTVIKPGELLTNPPPIAFLYVVLGGIGPSLWGIILTKITDGRIRFNLGNMGWWWLTVLIVPVVTFLLPLLRYMLGYQVGFDNIKNLTVTGIVIGITAGLMEEFGWRGYLLPRLLKMYNPLKASLVMGLVWGGLWHGYADYLGLGSKWLIIILLSLLMLTAWSILLTWVYLQTNGNMWLSILVHASISSSAYIFGQKYNSSSEELIWTVISVILAFIAAGVVFKIRVNITRR